VDQLPQLEGKRMIIMFSPKKPKWFFLSIKYINNAKNEN
jgi:hypothetical protein